MTVVSNLSRAILLLKGTCVARANQSVAMDPEHQPLTKQEYVAQQRQRIAELYQLIAQLPKTEASGARQLHQYVEEMEFELDMQAMSVH